MDAIWGRLISTPLFCLLALAAGEDEGLSSDPSGVVGGEEDGGGGDVGGLGDAAEGGRRFNLLAEVAFGEAYRVQAFGLDHAGVE